jgi:hypothetical protein
MSDINIQKEKAVEITVTLFTDGSTSVNVPEEFRENTSVNDIESILKDTLDKIVTNRIAASVLNIINKQQSQANNEQ